jgi:hypothetical protein
MFKVGDRVIVKMDLEDGMLYDGVSYVSSMDEFKNNVQIIMWTGSFGTYNAYHLAGDEDEYFFTDSMLEPAPTEPKPMTNLEKYEKEIAEMSMKSGMAFECRLHTLRTNKNVCCEEDCEEDTRVCSTCLIDSLRWLGEPYEEPLIITQFESDLLSTKQKDKVFNLDYQLLQMAEKGYFDGLEEHHKTWTVGEILESAEVQS